MSNRKFLRFFCDGIADRKTESETKEFEKLERRTMVDTPFWVEIDTPATTGLHINPA
jgi:hypothetical protein